MPGFALIFPRGDPGYGGATWVPHRTCGVTSGGAAGAGGPPKVRRGGAGTMLKPRAGVVTAAAGLLGRTSESGGGRDWVRSCNDENEAEGGASLWEERRLKNEGHA